MSPDGSLLAGRFLRVVRVHVTDPAYRGMGQNERILLRGETVYSTQVAQRPDGSMELELTEKVRTS